MRSGPLPQQTPTTMAQALKAAEAGAPGAAAAPARPPARAQGGPLGGRAWLRVPAGECVFCVYGKGGRGRSAAITGGGGGRAPALHACMHHIISRPACLYGPFARQRRRHPPRPLPHPPTPHNTKTKRNRSRPRRPAAAAARGGPRAAAAGPLVGAKVRSHTSMPVGIFCIDGVQGPCPS